MCAVSLVDRWLALGSELPAGWSQARIRLEVADAPTCAEAATLLAPAQPYRAGPTELHFRSAHDGSAPSPDLVTRLLRRLDDAGIRGGLEISDVGATAPAEPPAAGETEPALVDSWDRALAGLPPDWSDLLCELQLDSSDYVERAAVLCIQMNPRRVGTRNAFRFRTARTAGYGVSAQMARRCLERCDAEAIRGSVDVLRALSDTRLVATQGPVWQLAGKTV